MNVLPAVDVMEGKVVRLSQGDFATATIYGQDPVAISRSFMEQGARMVHVVDLEGARQGTLNLSLWASLRAADVVFQAGGGLRSAVSAESVLETGAARVVLGSAAVWMPDEVSRLIDSVGPDRVVVAIDVADGLAKGAGWEEEGRPAFEVLDELMAAGIERALLTAIARDGLLTGPDLELLARVQARYPGLGLIASGGVSSLSDLMALAEMGIPEVVVGRALYENRFTLAQAIEL